MKLRDAIRQVEQGKASSCAAGTPKWGVGHPLQVGGGGPRELSVTFSGCIFLDV